MTGQPQTGDATKLKAALSAQNNVKSVYVVGDAPIAPGAKVMTDIKGESDDKVAYVTMFGYSNDWLYGNNSELMLSNNKGDLSSKTALFDDGTAMYQYPGAGSAQGLFGGKQIIEDLAIKMVGNDFPVPTVDKVLKVTLQ